MRNDGHISSRYAKAFFLATIEVKEEDRVYGEIQLLNENLFGFPEIKKLLANKLMSQNEKIDLLKTAAGKTISASLDRFFTFLNEKGRLEFIHNISLEYLSLYRKEKNIVAIELTTAVKLDNKTLQKIKLLISKQQNATVEIIEKINPDIIGGFIFEMEDERLDASLKGELKKIKEQLLKKT